MKLKTFNLILFILIGTTTLIAGNKDEKFLVNGNCGMCKKRIEKAALSVEGVTVAEWDAETMELTITFDDAKTNLQKIHEAIAKSGHDTKLVKASDEKYSTLPACCKYDRDKFHPVDSTDKEESQ